jgi:hypothetical protein
MDMLFREAFKILIYKMENIIKICPAVFFISIILLSANAVKAQDNEKPCSLPEASQFDFWIGKWNLEWKDKDGKTLTGSNTVTKEFGGCVIEENFSTEDKSFTGRSLSVYSPAKKKWLQTWVDNSGAFLDFTGEYKDDKMTLWRKFTAKSGKEIMQRMVFYDIKANEFSWNWESSADGGTTWNLMWKIHYSRM